MLVPSKKTVKQARPTIEIDAESSTLKMGLMDGPTQGKGWSTGRQEGIDDCISIIICSQQEVQQFSNFHEDSQRFYLD